MLEKPNINNRTLAFRPSFSGKTYHMLKSLSRMPDRDIYIITKSPPEQYSNSKRKIIKIREEIKPLSENENPIMVFVDISCSRKSNQKNQFFLRSRHTKFQYLLSITILLCDLPKF